MKASDPAFPVSTSVNSDGYIVSSFDFEDGQGLTKREFFAAMAMQGNLMRIENGSPYEVKPSLQQSARAIAQHSVEYADALIDNLSSLQCRREG